MSGHKCQMDRGQISWVTSGSYEFLLYVLRTSTKLDTKMFEKECDSDIKGLLLKHCHFTGHGVSKALSVAKGFGSSAISSNNV